MQRQLDLLKKVEVYEDGPCERGFWEIKKGLIKYTKTKSIS